MIIKQLELENIKCYETARFDFSLGSTAIIGKNGSGKTTIIEAIAWALFDVLDYRRDDFVSRGKKRGRVKVIFESASDQRDYQVTRDTAGAYYVYDPVLDLRPAERKEDVLRFLTRHLGFEPGTDIGAIFRQAIGVAQGNFTSIFLATPSERKRVFDSLLKVEEYTKAAENLLSTTRWVESQLYRIGQEIARREASLEHLSRIGIEINQLENEVKAAGNESASLTNQLVELESKLRSDEELEKVLSETQNKISLLTEALKRETERLQEAENNLAEALKAKEIIVETQESAQKYKEAELRLADLENLRQNREKLRIDLAKTDAALSSVKNDKSRIQEEIEKIHLARKKIAELEPLAKIEADLTEHYNKLNEQSAPLEALQKIAADTNRKILALRNEFKQVKKRIDEIKALTADALSLQSLRDSESEIAKKIGIITGRIERDKKFREEIRGGLCPILSEKCLNLKPGQTLDQFLDDESSELFSELESLQAENKKIHSAIARALEIENQRLTLPQLEVRLDEIKAEGEKLKLELENLNRQLTAARKASEEKTEVETKLKSLGEPSAELKLLKSTIQKESELQELLTNADRNIERLASDCNLIREQLEIYANLDEEIKKYNQLKNATLADYEKYYYATRLAEKIPSLESKHKEAVRQKSALESELKSTESKLSEISKNFDLIQYKQTREKADQLRLRLSAVTAAKLEKENRLDKLKSDYEEYFSITKILDQAYKNRERYEKIKETTEYFRSVLREAAPVVAQNYVYRVSAEANQIFREITANAGTMLKWREDYGIIIEEDGYERPFQSLSGGEQMAAALSIRLALLKQLTDVRIAFFDEPTTNMDAERRENLAAQLGRIRDFDQIFVISHDDTFEPYLDNEIRLD